MSLSGEGDLDLSKLKVAELKQELKKRGLSVEGKKNELIERLQTSIGDSALLDDTHDDLLDDEDLSDEEVLDDSAIDTPPEPVKSTKRPNEEEEKRHPKKIILNRKVVEAPILIPAAAAGSGDTTTTESDTHTAIEAKQDPSAVAAAPPAKLTGLSQKERLELRAARFGAALSAQTSTVQNKPKAAVATDNVNIEVLKKRAERFGTVAPILEKVVLEEKKQLRINRFGGGENTTETKQPVTSPNGAAPVDKKSQRAARFQIVL